MILAIAAFEHGPITRSPFTTICRGAKV